MTQHALNVLTLHPLGVTEWKRLLLVDSLFTPQKVLYRFLSFSSILSPWVESGALLLYSEKEWIAHPCLSLWSSTDVLLSGLGILIVVCFRRFRAVCVFFPCFLFCSWIFGEPRQENAVSVGFTSPLSENMSSSFESLLHESYVSLYFFLWSL